MTIPVSYVLGSAALGQTEKRERDETLSALTPAADEYRAARLRRKPTWTAARWVGFEALAALTFAGVPASQN
ncbi:MAG: hypothetical protein JO188_03730 [Hyphomicrobiales bacterium]|nr:hypothetical protein [Acidobacteriaceae bacterium]MBV9751609.1 hypothetical protein [Hyphomicrobiales bacterium]